MILWECLPLQDKELSGRCDSHRQKESKKRTWCPAGSQVLSTTTYKVLTPHCPRDSILMPARDSSLSKFTVLKNHPLLRPLLTLSLLL